MQGRCCEGLRILMFHRAAKACDCHTTLTCMHVRKGRALTSYMSIYTYAYLFANQVTHKHLNKSVHKPSVYTHIDIFTSVSVYIYTCSCIYMYIYMCVYVFMKPMLQSGSLVLEPWCRIAKHLKMTWRAT